MCAEPNRNPVVHIAPFGMMVHLLSDESYAYHEGERLTEILELEIPAELVFFFGPHKVKRCRIGSVEK